MRQLTLSTVCMIAVLTTVPALAAPGEKPGKPSRTADQECTYTSVAKPRSGARTARHNPKQSKEMDCIVVKGYPNQDGRAILRRSLQKEAKDSLSTAIRPNLKSLLGAKPTS